MKTLQRVDDDGDDYGLRVERSSTVVKAFVLMLPVPFTLAASESLMRVQTAVEASARELER